MKKPSQKKQIRACLENHGNLTQLGALNMFGCMRLSDVIYKIKRDYRDEYEFICPSEFVPEIETKMVRTSPSKFSKTGKLVACYSLKIFD